MNVSRDDSLLVVAPHPDDEVLGCGGLITKIKENRGRVYVLFLTNGETSEFSKIGRTTSQERLKEIHDAMSYLEVDDWDIAFEEPSFHLKLDTTPLLDIISKIEKTSKVAIEKVQPTILACPQESDYNQDHRKACEASIAATRPAPNTHKVFIPTVIGYEFAATTNWGFEPYLSRNLIVSLEKDHLTKKQNAMKYYKTQVRESAHTRSIENIESLARIRGAMAGIEYAEGYHIYRTTL